MAENECKQTISVEAKRAGVIAVCREGSEAVQWRRTAVPFRISPTKDHMPALQPTSLTILVKKFTFSKLEFSPLKWR